MLENNLLISKKGIFWITFWKSANPEFSLSHSLIFKRNSSLNLRDFPDDFSQGEKKIRRLFFKKHDFSVEKRCLNYFDQSFPTYFQPRAASSYMEWGGSASVLLLALACVRSAKRHTVPVKPQCRGRNRALSSLRRPKGREDYIGIAGEGSTLRQVC